MLVARGTSDNAAQFGRYLLEITTGIPVTLFRCSLILPPRGFVGQVNTGDFLTRLLYGIVIAEALSRGVAFVKHEPYLSC